jgi:predicted glycosyltransferase
MRYIITIQHPAHVHFFKHAIRALEDNGHEVFVFARDKEVAIDLLTAYDIDHTVLVDGQSEGVRGLLFGQTLWEYRLLERARTINPDVIAGIGGTAAAHVGKLCGARSVVFTDTEHAPGNKITFPFADEIWTPECFDGDAGGNEKHVRYPGYHELAYLHPNRFEPDESVLESINLSPDDQCVVLRLVSWAASHDAGESGFDDVSDVVERLEATGAQVLITSEAPLPPALEDHRATVEPHRIHDLLAYADLFIGEGATMAVESAVLGTPAVYVNTLRMGYTDEIEARYDLLYNCQGTYRHHNALETATRILDGSVTTDWTKRREQLLNEKTDTTNVILEALRDDAPQRQIITTH